MRPRVRGSSSFITPIPYLRGEGIPAYAVPLLVNEVIMPLGGNEA